MFWHFMSLHRKSWHHTLTPYELAPYYKIRQKTQLDVKLFWLRWRRSVTLMLEKSREDYVIRAKMEDFSKRGVPCAFCHVSHWSQGLFVIGDPRITPVIQGHVEEILDGLNSTNTGASQSHPTKKLHLPPPLPGPFYHLNYRTLQSTLVAIAKNLGVDWSGDVPEWWPSTVLFSNRRKPPQHPNGKSILSIDHYSERSSKAFVNCCSCDCGSLLLQVTGVIQCVLPSRQGMHMQGPTCLKKCSTCQGPKGMMMKIHTAPSTRMNPAPSPQHEDQSSPQPQDRPSPQLQDSPSPQPQNRPWLQLQNRSSPHPQYQPTIPFHLGEISAPPPTSKLLEGILMKTCNTTIPLHL